LFIFLQFIIIKFMKPVLERIEGHSVALNQTITRDRVTAHLEAGQPAGAFVETLTPEEMRRISEVRLLILDDQFTRVINEGGLTFAMIRPHQELGKKKKPDSETTQEILDDVQNRGHFNIALQLPWTVSPEAFGEFYGHVKPKLLGIDKQAPDGTPSNAWELFERFNTTGAASFLVLDARRLQSTTGHQAWQLWRTFIGATNPLEASPGTLRNKYGSDYNNVVHGSDSLAAVHSDIQWMARQLRVSIT
jgi:nucleoside diphosphate kinase